MPHLTLEYSDNLAEPVDFDALFARLHAALAEPGAFRLQDLKSRAVAHRDFRVGAGVPGSAFVHLTLAIFAGREPAQQERIADRLLEILLDSFARSRAERSCEITVEIREMRRETYRKAAGARAPGT